MRKIKLFNYLAKNKNDEKIDNLIDHIENNDHDLYCLLSNLYIYDHNIDSNNVLKCIDDSLYSNSNRYRIDIALYNDGIELNYIHDNIIDIYEYI